MSRSPTCRQGEGSRQRGQHEQTLQSCRAQGHSPGGWDPFPPPAPFLLEPMHPMAVSTMAPVWRHQILVWLGPLSHIISLILFLVWKRAESGGGRKVIIPVKFPELWWRSSGIMVGKAFHKHQYYLDSSLASRSWASCLNRKIKWKKEKLNMPLSYP